MGLNIAQHRPTLPNIAPKPDLPEPPKRFTKPMVFQQIRPREHQKAASGCPRVKRSSWGHTSPNTAQHRPTLPSIAPKPDLPEPPKRLTKPMFSTNPPPGTPESSFGTIWDPRGPENKCKTNAMQGQCMAIEVGGSCGST